LKPHTREEIDVFPSGHYDILYKLEDIPQPKPQQPQQPLMVHLATEPFEEHLHERPGWHDLGGPDFGVPGMSFASPSQIPWSYNPVYDLSAASLQQPIPVSAYAPLPPAASQVDLMPQPASQDLQVGIPSIQHHLVNIDRAGPFRRSKFELETNYSSNTLHHTPFVTSAFKK